MVSLDGAPIAPEDVRALGIAAGDGSVVVAGPDFAVMAADREAEALHVWRNDDAVMAFAGYLDEPEELAASLGLDGTADHRVLVSEALARFGQEISARMNGGWSLLRWEVRARRLTLLISEMARDAMFFAADGRRVVVAPEMLRVCAIRWVGRTLDPEGFALNVCRAGLLTVRGASTPWKHVRRVLCGVKEIFSATERASLAPAELKPLEPWHGSFADAVEAMDVLCRRMVRQSMQRAGRSGFLLSGGIDSSLLSALGAAERGAGREMFCLTSVAPAGSGIPDEYGLSSAVARQLGVDQICVTPDEEAGPYRPSEVTLGFAQQPMMGMRHYLSERLWARAAEHGAHTLFDGVGGEFSITRKPDAGAHFWWLKRWHFRMMLWREVRQARGVWPEAGFHVQLAPALLASLPRDWEQALRNGQAQSARRLKDGPVGIDPGTRKSAAFGSYLPGGLRLAVPYFDGRLLRLAGSLPARLFEHGGETRALARAMLRGRVPEEVRTGRMSLPFSPDYRQRARRLAEQASARLPALRAAGAGEWVDLDWMEKSVRLIEQGKASGAAEMKTQLTFGAAEFVAWIGG